MAVVKIIELLGSSKTSTDDAAKQALEQAEGPCATSAPSTSSRPGSAARTWTSTGRTCGSPSWSRGPTSTSGRLGRDVPIPPHVVLDFSSWRRWTPKKPKSWWLAGRSRWTCARSMSGELGGSRGPCTCRLRSRVGQPASSTGAPGRRLLPRRQPLPDGGRGAGECRLRRRSDGGWHSRLGRGRAAARARGRLRCLESGRLDAAPRQRFSESLSTDSASRIAAASPDSAAT